MPLTTSALPGGAADYPAEALRVSQLLAAHTDAHGVVRIRVRGEHVLGDGADAHVHVLQIGEQILRLHVHQRADDCVVAARAGVLADL